MEACRVRNGRSIISESGYHNDIDNDIEIDTQWHHTCISNGYKPKISETKFNYAKENFDTTTQERYIVYSSLNGYVSPLKASIPEASSVTVN